MYGLGNWLEVAEHVGTKSKLQCIDHYTTAYMNSSCYPLPDMSHVNGKNRKELLAMAKVQGESKKGCRSEANQVETIWSVDKDDASASCSSLAWASVHNA